jgi:hypothetical protein
MQLSILAGLHVETGRQLARYGGPVGPRVDEETEGSLTRKPNWHRHPVVLIVPEFYVLGLRRLVDIRQAMNTLEFRRLRLGKSGRTRGKKNPSEQKTQWSHNKLPPGQPTPGRSGAQLTYR